MRLRHPERTAYVVPDLFGSYRVRLCAKPRAGEAGWHGHGEIVRQFSAADALLALDVVTALAEAPDPDSWRPGLALVAIPRGEGGHAAA